MYYIERHFHNEGGRSHPLARSKSPMNEECPPLKRVPLSTTVRDCFNARQSADPKDIPGSVVAGDIQVFPKKKQGRNARGTPSVRARYRTSQARVLQQVLTLVSSRSSSGRPVPDTTSLIGDLMKTLTISRRTDRSTWLLVDDMKE